MKLNGGNELDPPYSEEEVNNVLREKNFILSEELLGSALYSYLTKVSRRIYVAGKGSHNTIVFDLNKFPNNDHPEKICIPYDTTRITEYDIYYDDELDVRYILSRLSHQAIPLVADSNFACSR